MSRLGVIGDVHAHGRRLARVLDALAGLEVDGVLLVGDLGSHHVGLASQRTPDGDARYLASVRAVLDRVATLGVPVHYVPGNHDLPELDLPGNLDRQVATVAGLRVGGIGGAGPERFGFCYEWSEADIRVRPPLDADVLLVHTPPFDTALDRASHGAHVGSRAIRERALAQAGFLVCGHIHEAAGAVQLGDCLCLNAGGLGEPWGKAQVGWLEREGGEDRVGHLDLETGARRSWTRQRG